MMLSWWRRFQASRHPFRPEIISQHSSPDFDSLDDRSTRPSPADPFAGKSCPVCGKLDLDAVVGKGNTRSLEYYIEPSEQNREIFFQWKKECGLCNLVYDLDQHWSKQGDNVQGMKYDGYKYWLACGRNGSAPLHLQIVADWAHFAVHTDPLSRSSIARMKHWIARCNSNDDECKAPETALPTRILDVKDEEDIRLCETGAQSGAYIALSHCWGLPGKEFITTHDTIANMKAGFAIGQAPATFRDAITITRLLGFRYIWIDSLCIIQDDTADWRREAARMGSVYANASLTIAAANAKDDNDGFLRPRRDFLTSLRIMSSTGNSAQVYLQTQHDEIELGVNDIEPLDTRGWVLQERNLSRRSLRFGSRRISWYCQCFDLYENETDQFNRLSAPMKWLKPSVTASGQCLYSEWYTLVSRFTERLLTYDTDKLPALSGLATEVAKFQNGTYYAGLWWEDMAYGMLWFRSRTVELNKPSEYLAPSWSWASLNGQPRGCRSNNGCLIYGPWILYEERPVRIMLPNTVFRECCVDDESDRTCRAIKPGWLDLSAPIVKLIQCESEDTVNFCDYGEGTVFRFAHLDVPYIKWKDHGAAVERRRKYRVNTIGVFDLARQDRTEILGLFLMFSHDKLKWEKLSEWPISGQTAQQDSLHWSSLYGILIEFSRKTLPWKRLPFKRVGYFKSVNLEAGEALQILKGAEVQDIRLY